VFQVFTVWEMALLTRAAAMGALRRLPTARSCATVSAAASATELAAWRDGIESAGWIHMNAAGASPMPASAHQAVLSHLELERSTGGYAAAGPDLSKELNGTDTHRAVAALLDVGPDEVALHESAQAAWARAFYSLRFRGPQDRILCFESEYAGNGVAFLQAARRTGVTVEVLPMRANGAVDLELLHSRLKSSPVGGRDVVALTHVGSDTSIVQPAAAVGALAQAHGALYLLDACQSIGQLPVLPRDLGCHFLCGTGRKWLRGPRGIGFLYASRGLLGEVRDDAPTLQSAIGEGRSDSLVGEPPLIDHISVRWKSRDEYVLAPGARRFEMWEASHAARAGLTAAARLCHTIGPERIHKLSSVLACQLRAGLAEMPGITMRDLPPGCDIYDTKGEDKVERCAIVTFEAFSKTGITSAALLQSLASRKIGVSVSPSFHTFRESEWVRHPAVRISPSYFNTKEEVDVVVHAVREIIAANSM
jgi:cysteine desulfurase/selenocysteine lyase